MTTTKYITQKEFNVISKKKGVKKFPNPDIIEYQNISYIIAKKYTIKEITNQEKQWYGINPTKEVIELKFNQHVPIELFLRVVNRKYNYENNEYGIQYTNGSLGSNNMIVELDKLDTIKEVLKRNNFTLE